MPRPAPYTGTRRLISQVLMWVILAGTVALAALVDRAVNRTMTIAVSEPVTHGNMTVRLPRGWKTVPTEGTAAVVAVSEHGADEEGRTLTVFRQRIGTLRSPFEYLAAGGIIDAEVMAGKENPFQPTTVAGSPGIIAEIHYTEADDVPRKMIIACAVLPSRLAIAVRLDGVGAEDEGDTLLVQRVASSITLSDSPSMLPVGATVNWPNGMSIKSPAQFRAVDDRDSQTTSRFLVDDRSPQQWASIEVTPCVYFRDDGQSVLTTLLGAHDSRMFHATIAEIAPGQFRATVPAEQAAMPTATFVASDNDGHAVLATFRGTSERAAEFDALWNEIAKSIHFANTPYRALLDAGHQQIVQIQSAGLDKLIPANEREEQWWRWVDTFAGHPFGWSHFRFEQPAKLEALRETRKRADRRLIFISQEWASSPDLKTHNAEVIEKVTTSADSGMAESFRQVLHIAHGRMDISVSSNGQPAPMAQAPLPGEFIPGAWIPHLLGKFGTVPMMIRTESMFGSEVDFATAFQTVAITPVAPPDGSDAGTRVFTLEVNGTGKLSRWTIRPNGQLDRIDFADGIYCESADIKAIRLTFNGDQRMEP
jgi:hypothetical protein